MLRKKDFMNYHCLGKLCGVEASGLERGTASLYLRNMQIDTYSSSKIGLHIEAFAVH